MIGQATGTGGTVGEACGLPLMLPPFLTRKRRDYLETAIVDPRGRLFFTSMSPGRARVRSRDADRRFGGSMPGGLQHAQLPVVPPGGDIPAGAGTSPSPPERLPGTPPGSVG